MVKAACEKNGCLYVADEVQSGAGRTGKMWAIQYSKVKPDMLTWGKGMGGDMPMAGVTYRADMEEALREGSQPSTFAGNAMGCEVAHDQHRPDHRPGDRPARPGRRARRGDQGLFTDAMPQRAGASATCAATASWSASRSSPTARPRSRSAGEKIGEITFKLLNAGILMTPCGRHANVFRFMPPLTIPHDYAFKATDDHDRHPQGVLSRRGQERSEQPRPVQRAATGRGLLHH